MDLHNYKRQFERQIELVKESKEIPAENKDIIFNFVNNMTSDGIGVAKLGRYCLDLRKFSKLLNMPFDSAKEKDIRRVVAQIEQGELAPESKKCFKVMLRKLYRYIHNITQKGIYPDEVKWISIALPNKGKKLPEELLTEEEIQSILKCCQNLRDKALIAALAESGCRISEIGLLKIKHISFEEYGARLSVQGKTGSRRVLVVNSAPYLSAWINDHPTNDNPDSYLWHNPQNNGFLTYSRITAILSLAVQHAGIKKRVYPHLLRHSRATHLAPIMSEAAMKQYFGWTQGSKMAGIYIHLSGKETDEAILKANGIVLHKEEKVIVMKPLVCPRCKTKNGSTNRFCNMCSMVLSEKEQREIYRKESERSELNLVLDNLLGDKEIMELFMNKIREKQLAKEIAV